MEIDGEITDGVEGGGVRLWWRFGAGLVSMVADLEEGASATV